MKIKDWPEDDRPREKFLQRGSYGLTDTELLAIIIGKGVKNRSALDLAKEILQRVGSLKRLGEKTVSELEQLKINGLGRAKLISILAAIDLGRRSLSKKNEEVVIFKHPKDVYHYYYPLIGGLKYELFKVAAVDAKNSLLRDSTISKGILDASLVHPREVFKFALNENASGLFLIHNHPSGILKPSDDDLKITERLRNAGVLMGINIIDHVIITDQNYYSFSQHNLL
ncbi:MAG TPA: JAB domain-containing protein [candidate division WOR-3 bacterium]|uniref:JAB domain-containing protein n=1 Tax=candidate division WOR-3 bacterium TaxID=2052148 RepID=A0A9C9EN31_UNCW3|nr:JAB domain-containing protein [candidate division WOR-3 bacterium]